jgi:hypothetical protein
MGPLALWVFWSWWSGRQDLDSERALLGRIHPLAKTSDEDTTLEPEDIDKFHEILESVRADSLVKRVTLAVLNSRFVQSPDLEAIMGLLLSREATRLGAVRNAPNLLMLAGLLGTVFGLAGSVGGLAEQIGKSLRDGNTQELSRSLLSTLEQMQGAFGATLWGIVLSIISALLLGWVSGARNRFAADMQDFALVELVPAVFPRSSEAQLERQTRVIKTTSNVLTQFNTTLGDATKRFDAMLSTTGDKVTTSLEQLGQMSVSMQATMQGVLDGIGKLGGQLEEGAKALAVAQDSSAKTFENASTDLKTQLGGQAKTIEGFQQTFTQGSQKILEGITEVSGRLDRTVEAFRDEGKAQLVRIDQLIDRLDGRFERLERAIGKITENNRTEITKMTDRLQGTQVLLEADGPRTE